jgi:transcriptional regulator with XRE-family HTH domain
VVAPAPVGYGTLVRQLRIGRGVSGYALARGLGLHPNQLARTEEGARAPEGPAEVRAVGQALSLDRADLDRLLAAAGYWPSALLELGPDDPTLRALGAALTASEIPPAVRQRLRSAVEALADGFLALAGQEAGSATGEGSGGEPM